MVRDGVETARNLSLRFRVMAGAVENDKMQKCKKKAKNTNA